MLERGEGEGGGTYAEVGEHTAEAACYSSGHGAVWFAAAGYAEELFYAFVGAPEDACADGVSDWGR